MSVHVKRLPDKPIIIATFKGNVDWPSMELAFKQSAELTQEGEDTIYRITDLREADTDIGEILSIVKKASKGMPGSTTDPRFRAVFVGTTHWIAFTQQTMKLPQFGGVELPAFTSIEEALAYIELQLTQETHNP